MQVITTCTLWPQMNYTNSCLCNLCTVWFFCKVCKKCWHHLQTCIPEYCSLSNPCHENPKTYTFILCSYHSKFVVHIKFQMWLFLLFISRSLIFSFKYFQFLSASVLFIYSFQLFCNHSISVFSLLSYLYWKKLNQKGH